MRLRALFRGVVGVIATLITLVAAPVANARLNMVFTGVEGSNQIYWHFSGCVTVDTATTFGPLNDAAWLYPDGTVGWSFFFNTGTGDDLVKKSANTTLVSAQEYRWVIRDSSGSVLQIIPVQITSWWINLNGQAIEPRTQPYTVPNLEVGQQLCLEGSGSFTVDYDFFRDQPNNAETVFNSGSRDRQANGGMLRQKVRIIGSSESSSYSTFQSSQFPGETDPAKVGPLADFDRGGTSNLTEYALGMNPRWPDRVNFFPMPSIGARCVVFKMRINDPKLVYTLEYGQALQFSSTVQVRWDGEDVSLSDSSAPVQVEEDLEEGDPDPGFRWVRLCINEASFQSSAIFMRLKVSLAE